MNPVEDQARRRHLFLASAETNASPEQKQNLLDISHELEYLLASLKNKTDEQSIIFINNRILDEQHADTPSPAQINEKKNLLMGAWVPHYTKLFELSVRSLPSGLKDYLGMEGIRLEHFAEDTMDNITAFMSQKLTHDTNANKFKAVELRDKVERTLTVIKKLL